MTAATFAWVWGLLSVAWPARYAVCLGLAVVLGAGTWLATRTPWAGVLATGMGLAVLGLMGIGTEQPVPLGPLFVVLVLAGYLAPPPWSMLAVPVLLAATAIPAQWDLASVVFGGLLLLLPWWFGLRVRVRDGRRKEAAENARRLAGLDPAALAQQAAATEREEVAASAFEVIGHAVAHMNGQAASARALLDPVAIDAVHRKGEEATQRLRALLVLLREDEQPTPVPGPLVAESNLERGSEPRWRRIFAMAWPSALILLDVTTMPFVLSALRGTPLELPDPGFVALVALPLMVAVAVRDHWPVAAPLGAALVLATGAIVGVVDAGRDGLWLMIAAIALSWAAGQAGSRRVVAAWFVFTMVLGMVVYLDASHYLPIYLALEVLPFGAAAVWSGHHAAETASLDRASLREAEIEAAERAAVSQERLHLARDLHDAASHAVGTMMMQANAARVLRERDPEGARAALDAVVDIGREAAAELQAIRGPQGRLPEVDSTEDIAQAIAPLVTAARRTAARVSTELDLQVHPGPQDVVLLLRIVREGLANAVRHAPHSDVRVQVCVRSDTVRVTVVNGPSHGVPGQDGGVSAPMGLGLGLRGLRELVSARCGDLAAGPADDGFRLSASFPAQPAERPVVLP